MKVFLCKYDNAKGIVDMSEMPHEVETADVPDSAGHAAKAIAMGFSISAAALTAPAMYAAYAEVIAKYSGGANSYSTSRIRRCFREFS